jgi:hypothetical protein
MHGEERREKRGWGVLRPGFLTFAVVLRPTEVFILSPLPDVLIGHILAAGLLD